MDNASTRLSFAGFRDSHKTRVPISNKQTSWVEISYSPNLVHTLILSGSAKKMEFQAFQEI